jgi:cytochrome P450
VERLRPEIQRIADRLVDELERRTQPVDLVEAFALPLPSLVIADLLGVPEEDRPFFEERSRMLVSNRVGTDVAVKAFEEMREYMERLVAGKRERPGDDVLTRLDQMERAGDMGHDEVVDTGRLLLLAGHVTTANMIALGVTLLLQHPDQMAELRAQPGLLKGAIEEMLRHQTLLRGGLRRVATEDVEVGGQLIRAGEGVVVLLSAANRDRLFAEAETFDIHRNVRHHLAFGYGSHQCIGQLLAREELHVALGTILRRLPNLELAVPLKEVRFRDDEFLHGLRELPIRW